MNREVEKTQIKILEMDRHVVKPKKVTNVQKIFDELEALEIGDCLVKKDLVKKYWYCSSWADVDEFVIRSFDTNLCHAKKLMPEKKFKTKSGLIERIL